MLTSITPLGERGRGQRWSITALWLFVGHVVGGTVLGLLMAGAGSFVRLAGDVRDGPSVVAVVVVTVVAAAFDLAGGEIPGKRQVDERWLTTYRGWVYGLGFGVQLGFGLVTVVNSALLAAFLLAGVLSGSGVAIVLGAGFGAIRGVLAVAGGWVQRGDQLRRLHRWVDRREPVARTMGDVAAAGAAVAALMALLAG